MKTNDNSRMGLNRMSAESRCGVAKPSIPIAIEGYDVKIFTDDWNCSAPHGAGRVLSLTQAYEKITMKDFEAFMQGIYSESINDFTRDESPMVYKPASGIIANIGETERLILRSCKYEDRETFAEMNGNRTVMKYFPATLSVEESNAFVDRINAQFEETGFGLYAVAF